MNHKEHELVDQLQANLLKLDDKFSFECKMCGNCCRNRTSPILITGIDVFRLSRALDMEPAQVVKEYTKCYIGKESHIPMIYLAERDDGSCKFLCKGKCTVQESKPVTCAIFPLGRYITNYSSEYQYFKQNDLECQCEGIDNKDWTLKEWLDNFQIQQLDTMSKAWNRLLLGIVKYTYTLKEPLSDEILNMIAGILYINYDPSKSFEYEVAKNILVAMALFKEKFGVILDFDSED